MRGASTCSVGTLLELLRGSCISASTVSPITRSLETELCRFQRWPIEDRYRSLLLDGAIPLPGPPVDRLNHRPGEWYRYVVQVHWRRVQRFLSDRLPIIMLLQADLVSAKQPAPSRFEPDIGLNGVVGLGTRLGLWFDGKARRFLVLDSAEKRKRWLEGEEWTDTPSDLEAFVKETYGDQTPDDDEGE